MLISIQGWPQDIYWMHVEISTETLLYDLDRFLRDIWLECCGEERLCDDCARTHDCGEDMMLPVVNSPRTGQCGYGEPSE